MTTTDLIHYDPSTDSYPGYRLRRGDIVTDGSAHYAIDECHGFLISLCTISSDGRYMCAPIYTVSVDPGADYYLPIWPTGAKLLPE